MGNLIGLPGGDSLAFDGLGRLAQWDRLGATSRFWYVPSESDSPTAGLRFAKVVTGGPGAEQGTFLESRDPEGRPIGRYQSDSTQPTGFATQEELLYLDDFRLIATVRNGQAYPIVTDAQGTSRFVLDSTDGAVRWDWDATEPFGNQAPVETPTAGYPGFAFEGRFPGQWRDSSTGAFHNGWRDYLVGEGRYAQADPMGLAAGWNGFGYVGGNPMGGVDPRGLIQANSYMAKLDKNGVPQTKSYCYIGPYLCVVFEVGSMKTDKNNQFEVLKLISGPEFYEQNCHAYGFGINYWVEDPRQVYKDEYSKTSNRNEADLVLFSDDRGAPLHTSIVGHDGKSNRGKNGALPAISTDYEWMHSSNKQYYKKVK